MLAALRGWAAFHSTTYGSGLTSQVGQAEAIDSLPRVLSLGVFNRRSLALPRCANSYGEVGRNLPVQGLEENR